MVIGVILLILLIISIFFIGMNNSLIGKKNKITNAEGNINVMIKKRFDLIPGLIKISKGYMDYEKSPLEKISEMRNMYVRTLNTEDKIDLNNKFTDMMTQFYNIVDNYPQLKSDEAFKNLQNALNEVDEKISASRRSYSSAVAGYNNAVQGFPKNLVAGIMGFNIKHVFKIEKNDKNIDTKI